MFVVYDVDLELQSESPTLGKAMLVVAVTKWSLETLHRECTELSIAASNAEREGRMGKWEMESAWEYVYIQSSVSGPPHLSARVEGM